MELMTQQLSKDIPLLYATENIALDDKVLQIKYFTPDSSWTWYVVEYDPNERLCFGYIKGLESEWGYFSLSELENVKGLFGLSIERDLHFNPIKFKDLKV